jgi:hypothetical protein
VSHCGLAIYMKTYLNAKEELWKLKHFTMQKNINLQKKSSERNQNLSRYYYNNSIIANLKFQHNPKYQSFKNPHIKIYRPIIIIINLPRGPKSLKAIILYNESKHNILALADKANKLTTLLHR